MSNVKASLRVGQRVTFFRTHDKFTPLAGTIVFISDDDDLVTVKTEEGNGSVSRNEVASAADCTVLPDGQQAPAATGGKPLFR